MRPKLECEVFKGFYLIELPGSHLRLWRIGAVRLRNYTSLEFTATQENRQKNEVR